jgi:hypothetical protein
MDFIAGAGLAVGTLLVLVIALGVVGFVVLFARRGDRAVARSGGSSIPELSRRAGTLLVRADDAVREADDELGYAIAQFGAERARPWADALATARGQVAEAFRLRQALDDSVPDSDREKREWTLQIIALCERALGAIAEQDAAFTGLRGQEANAEGTLRDLIRRIEDAGARLATADDQLAELDGRFAPTVLSGIRSHPAEVRALLDRANEIADAAARGISSSGVSSVSGILGDGERTVRRADALLDAVERTARDLDSASAALDRLRATTVADLAEARAERDSAPDADSGAAIIDAIAAVEAFMPSAPADPVADLDRLGAAVAQLDSALASSRNQKQRFAHARAAYEGTLVSARSQIAVVRDLVAGGRSGVSARTRLAEAERQLMLAEAETDPVEALDTIRRAVTHARDADALARYDLGG